ncbi:LOG family protein [Caldovatus aquaticus]|uniref:Cytokinin riboside 5'-monophosphate phosphoribohydrolase n=1 Tax=Caldovatus aquaticus TaxID=2865671 RepID=A0ABS7F477_9PROT|nr:TIGR00730 family Rossman fold protein [Caldovatus aquaticus]MBW8270431.1 TIGR00730 family Rossman fold protein [Caldovatus aquaticus]
MAHPIRSVAVFCGSRTGHDPAHHAAAAALGRGLARAGLTLVYGGGSIGLMGAVADAALAEGGRVHGVIPDFLTRIERPHGGFSRLEITDSMHARKARMFALADAFVVLSGGLGTLDETLEILTSRQLGLHAKPILLLDAGGWAKPLARLIESVIGMGFAAPEHRRLFALVPDVPSVLALLGVLETEAAATEARL